MKKFGTRLRLTFCLSLLAGIALSFPASTPAAGPPSGIDVTVINTPLPVQGTVNVGNFPASNTVTGSVSITGTPTVNVVGTVTTQSASPGQPFSHTFTTTSAVPAFVGIDCVANLPAGTGWSISHFSIANGSASINAFFRLALLNSSNQIETVGPRIHAGPGETVQLTFPQPYILSSPGSGNCLVADTATDVFVTVVGFRQ